MIVLGLPFAIALLGLVIYYIAKDPKHQQVGYAMFWTGLLAGLLQTARVADWLK